MVMHALFVFCFLSACFACIHAHGRLLEPPGRSTAWRYGFNTPTNVDDNALNCGGYGIQWSTNGGKCGVCGDNWSQPTPRDHEAGGKYGTGTIVREYTQGQIITVTVEITANHLGFFEFRLCPVNNGKIRATQACLDDNVLKHLNGSVRNYIGSTLGKIYVTLRLPAHVTCTLCVLQWKYHTGNSWGIDEKTGKGCLGCGPVQEQFYGCADIAIRRGNIQPTTKPIPTPTTKPITPKPTTKKPVLILTTKQPVTPKPTPKPVTQKPTTKKPVIPATETPVGKPSLCGFICRFKRGKRCPEYCQNTVHGWTWQ